MKSEVKTFLNLLSNYKDNQHQIELLNEKYDLIFYQLRNVKSYPLESCGTTNQLDIELSKHELRNKLEKIENKINFYKMINKYVDGVLDVMQDNLKKATIEIYCDNKTYYQVAPKYNYSSAGLYRNICADIEKALLKALF